MKYYLVQPYQDIPQFAEVEMIGHCFDSGYSCFEVKYRGRTYKPFERDVKSSEEITDTFVEARNEFERAKFLYNQTIMKDFR